MKSLKLGAFCLLLGITLQSCYCIPLLEDCILVADNGEEQEATDTQYHLAPQQEKKKTFMKGMARIEVGANLSFKSDAVPSNPYGTVRTKPGLGFSVGVGRELYLNPEFLLHPSIGITRTSAGEEFSLYVPGDDFTINVENTYSFTQLSVPLHAEYRVLNRQLGFFGGPALNFLLGARLKSSEGNGSTNIADNSSKFQLAMQAGASFTPRPRTGWIGKTTATLKYNYAITSMYHVGGSVPRDYFHGVTLGFSYRFLK